MSQPLSDTQIAELLAPKKRQTAQTAQSYPPPIQRGPIRFYDKELLCLNSMHYEVNQETNERVWTKNKKGKCGSPTYLRFRGIPMCMIHCLDNMNILALELGVES